MSAPVPNPQAVLEQLEEIKQTYLDAQNRVATIRVTGHDPEKHVWVTVLGLGEVSDITINPEAVQSADTEVLQGKILAAFRLANTRARDEAARILAPLSITLPPLPSSEEQEFDAPPTTSALSTSSEPSEGLTENISASLPLSSPVLTQDSASSTSVKISPEPAALETVTSGSLSNTGSVENVVPPGPSDPLPTTASVDLTLHDEDYERSQQLNAVVISSETPAGDVAARNDETALVSAPSEEPDPTPVFPSLAHYQHFRPRW